jgi:hypothetical protein
MMIADRSELTSGLRAGYAESVIKICCGDNAIRCSKFFRKLFHECAAESIQQGKDIIPLCGPLPSSGSAS